MRTGVYVAAAFSLGVLSAALPANAADFGGSCCADLEERIAELEATTVRKGNRKVSLTVYGEVNQAVMFWDDGVEDNAYVVTNQTTKNLLGFEGSASITSEWSAGFRIEIELRVAPSDFVDQFNPTFGGGIHTRHANWWIESKSLGRITVGQGSNATDGIAEIDLSGSSAAAISAVETWNEGFFLRAKDGSIILLNGGTGIGLYADLFRGNFDGGRGNLVRYDTPVIGGFVASAAWGEDDDWDVALRYFGEFSGFQLAAGIGYHEGVITDTDNFSTGFFKPKKEWTGSASVLHSPTGIFVTVAGGAREWDDPALIGEKYVYGKAGVFQRWSTLGKTSIYGEYYHVWDVGAEGDAKYNEEASLWGAGVVQHIDAAAMEVYLAYRHYWADDLTDFFSDTDHDVDFHTVMTGARIKF